MLNIKMHRGDTKQLKFRRLSNGEPITNADIGAYVFLIEGYYN